MLSYRCNYVIFEQYCTRPPMSTGCISIPQGKRELPTPKMARRFPHLKEIASEIPPFNNDANIQLLIGRDAPKLLNARDLINGQNGAPWVQRLFMGWTITGQMCLDLPSGQAHALVRHTNHLLLNQISSLERALNGWRLEPMNLCHALTD